MKAKKQKTRDARARARARRCKKRHGRWLLEREWIVRGACRNEEAFGLPQGVLSSRRYFYSSSCTSRCGRWTGTGAREAKGAAPTCRLPTDKKKRCSPLGGTSSFVVAFLTRGAVREAYQAERMSSSSAEGSSPQMGLMNCSIVPVSSPEPSGTSASEEPLRGLP